MKTDQLVAKMFTFLEKETRGLDFLTRVEVYGELVTKLEEQISEIQDEIALEYEDQYEDGAPERQRFDDEGDDEDS